MKNQYSCTNPGRLCFTIYYNMAIYRLFWYMNANANKIRICKKVSLAKLNWRACKLELRNYKCKLRNSRSNIMIKWSLIKQWTLKARNSNRLAQSKILHPIMTKALSNRMETRQRARKRTIKHPNCTESSKSIWKNKYTCLAAGIARIQ